MADFGKELFTYPIQKSRDHVRVLEIKDAVFLPQSIVLLQDPRQINNRSCTVQYDGDDSLLLLCPSVYSISSLSSSRVRCYQHWLASVAQQNVRSQN